VPAQLRIAIVGGGIAGLTTAAALARAGMGCELFDQTDVFVEAGAGLQLAPNATRVLNRLGLGGYLRSVAACPEAIEMRRWDDNRVLRRTALGAACQAMFGAEYYTMHRADLHSGLVELLGDVRFRLGSRCTAVEQTGREARMHFQDGSSESADVVIGADGIHSTVRATLSADRPRFSGHSIFRGLIPAERVPGLLGEPKVVLWLGPGRHCVCYPVRAGQLVSVGATSPAPDWHEESWTADGKPEDLLAQYAGWTAEVDGVLSSLRAVSQWALHDRDELERWSGPRLTLVGDAAHPMLPFLAQGANQAIEDAVVIADVLRGMRPDDVPAALARYERIRRQRVREVHRVSRANTEMLHLPDGPAQRERDRLLGETAALKSQEWLYGYDAAQAARPVYHEDHSTRPTAG
jgi:salicylate hydroxylase